LIPTQLQSWKSLSRILSAGVFWALFSCLSLYALPRLEVVSSPLNGRTVNFTDILNDLADAKARGRVPKSTPYLYQPYEYKDIKIVYDLKLDKAGMDVRWSKGAEVLTIDFPVEFINVSFDEHYWFLLRHYNFTKRVAIKSCQNLKLIAKECSFQNLISIEGCVLDFVEFERCNINNGIYIASNTVNEHIYLKNSFIGFYKYTSVNDLPMFGFGKKHNNLLTIENKLGEYDIVVEKCRIQATAAAIDSLGLGLNLTNMHATSLVIRQNVFNNVPINLSNAMVENGFTFSLNQFTYICADGFSFNPANSNVEWGYEGFTQHKRGQSLGIAGFKLVVSNESSKRLKQYDPKAYPTPDTTRFISQSNDFQRLIAAYFQLYNYYKQTGNQDMANFCYYELKSVQTTYYSLHLNRGTADETYQQTLLFKYWGNIFLRTFCDYGLNPFKAIMVSFYVLVAFALLYLILPLNILGLGYTIYQFGNLDVVRQGAPRLAVAEAILFGWLPLNGLPDPVPRSMFGWQLLQAFSYFLRVSLYLIARGIACIMLSLNTFILLAAGEFPYRGYMLYLLILEGVFGWMLLTVFSVTLMSQLIQ
jgi:hypothetical protein